MLTQRENELQLDVVAAMASTRHDDAVVMITRESTRLEDVQRQCRDGVRATQAPTSPRCCDVSKD